MFDYSAHGILLLGHYTKKSLLPRGELICGAALHRSDVLTQIAHLLLHILGYVLLCPVETPVAVTLEA